MSIIAYELVEEKIIELRGEKVIIDSDVAELYEVETKRINEAVSRNTEKFPDGYIISLTEEEKQEVVANCDHLELLKFSPHLPKAFTERGLYMLATILKSKKATETTLAIIDTFSKVREIGRSINALTLVKEGSEKQKSLIQRTGELITDLLQPDDRVDRESETSIELNMAFVKFKYSIKKKDKEKV